MQELRLDKVNMTDFSPNHLRNVLIRKSSNHCPSSQNLTEIFQRQFPRDNDISLQNNFLKMFVLMLYQNIFKIDQKNCMTLQIVMINLLIVFMFD